MNTAFQWSLAKKENKNFKFFLEKVCPVSNKLLPLRPAVRGLGVMRGRKGERSFKRKRGENIWKEEEKDVPLRAVLERQSRVSKSGWYGNRNRA